MYNLRRQTGRVQFDQVVTSLAEVCLERLCTELALAQNPREYALSTWEAWLDNGIEKHIFAFDLERAKARYLITFAETVEKWQRSKRREVLDAELSGRETSYTTSLEISMSMSGRDFGSLLIQIVVLDRDGDTVAYRIASDTQGGTWQIGDKTSVIDMCFVSHDAIQYIQQGKKSINFSDVLAQMETLTCE